jgi:transcriptional regulator with XRE-family HTH domain
MEMQDLYAALGRRVAERRKAIGITQGTLAARSEFTRATVASIEAGRQRVTLEQLYALGSALDLGDLSELIPLEFPQRKTSSVPLGSDLNSIQAAQVRDAVRIALESARGARRRA